MKTAERPRETDGIKPSLLAEKLPVLTQRSGEDRARGVGRPLL